MANANILKGLREGVGGRKRSPKNERNIRERKVESVKRELRSGGGFSVGGVEAIDDEGEAGGEDFDTAHDEVVGEEDGNGDEEAEHGGGESEADAADEHLLVGHTAVFGEEDVEAVNGAEEADERSDGDDGFGDEHAAFEA